MRLRMLLAFMLASLVKPRLKTRIPLRPIVSFVNSQTYAYLWAPALVSATISNLVMEDIEQRALASSPIQTLFWKRYVDGVISAVP